MLELECSAIDGLDDGFEEPAPTKGDAFMQHKSMLKFKQPVITTKLLKDKKKKRKGTLIKGPSIEIGYGGLF